MCCVCTYSIQCKTPLRWDGSRHIIYLYPFHILHLSSTRDYKSQHKMFIIHGQPWGYIVIDPYYMPNIIVGILEGIWVDVIHVYAQSKDLYFILKFMGHVSSICFMTIEYVGIHITAHSLQCEAQHLCNIANSFQRKRL